MNRCTFARSALLAALLVASLVRPARAGEFPNDWTFDDDDKTRSAHEELIGKPMPRLDVTDWANGAVTPEQMKGKILVIDLYATWCGPCMAAIPHNNELLEKYKEKGVLVLGVCTNRRGQEKMEQVVKERGIKYPTAKDPKLTTQEAWHVMYYPTYAVVDRAGVVRALGLQPQYVEKVVDKVLQDEKKNASK